MEETDRPPDSDKPEWAGLGNSEEHLTQSGVREDFLEEGPSNATGHWGAGTLSLIHTGT